jgi:hypothetical protein
MSQLSLFPPVHFREAEEFMFFLDECELDIRAGYITLLDKPVGMKWEVWYDWMDRKWEVWYDWMDKKLV